MGEDAINLYCTYPENQGTLSKTINSVRLTNTKFTYRDKGIGGTKEKEVSRFCPTVSF